MQTTLPDLPQRATVDMLREMKPGETRLLSAGGRPAGPSVTAAAQRAGGQYRLKTALLIDPTEGTAVKVLCITRL